MISACLASANHSETCLYLRVAISLGMASRAVPQTVKYLWEAHLPALCDSTFQEHVYRIHIVPGLYISNIGMAPQGYYYLFIT